MNITENPEIEKKIIESGKLYLELILNNMAEDIDFQVFDKKYAKVYRAFQGMIPEVDLKKFEKRYNIIITKRAFYLKDEKKNEYKNYVKGYELRMWPTTDKGYIVRIEKDSESLFFNKINPYQDKVKVMKQVFRNPIIMNVKQEAIENMISEGIDKVKNWLEK